jgi:ferric-dicitrate binding protein FerR (iron transport regulator)
VEDFDAHIFSFFEDDAFIQWATRPDEASNAYWDAWLVQNPDRADDLLKARQMAQDLAKAQKLLNAEKLSKDIWGDIHANMEAPQNAIPIPTYHSKRTSYWIAASIAGLLLVASSFYFLYNTNKNSSAGPSQKIASVVVNDNLQHTNSSAESRIVYLVDGSKVTLQPGSSIKHAVFLQKDKREIYLDGDAFFEVAKDPNRPFYVYAHDIVLRVLGTSFNVKTNKSTGNITVVVRTGKVSVYKKSNIAHAEFILAPNEGIRYTAQTQSMVRSEGDHDFLKSNSKPEAPAVNFNFEEMPVAKIFSTLEEAYGIKIHYDEKIFSKCIINTSLNDETFDEKLKIICEAVSANYRIENNEVFVEGKACK